MCIDARTYIIHKCIIHLRNSCLFLHTRIHMHEFSNTQSYMHTCRNIYTYHVYRASQEGLSKFKTEKLVNTETFKIGTSDMSTCSLFTVGPVFFCNIQEKCRIENQRIYRISQNYGYALREAIMPNYSPSILHQKNSSNSSSKSLTPTINFETNRYENTAFNLSESNHNNERVKSLYLNLFMHLVSLNNILLFKHRLHRANGTGFTTYAIHELASRFQM